MFYLPPEKSVSHVFLQQILTGEKLALEKRVVSMAKVPTYPELSVDRLWSIAKHDEALCKYLPDGPKNNEQLFQNKKYRCDKSFLWHILASMRPDVAADLEAQSIKSRREMKLKDQVKKTGVLNILPHFAKKLQQMPIVSGKWKIDCDIVQNVV